MTDSITIPPPSGSRSPLFVGLLAVYAVVLIISLIIFLRRRHLPPLRSRDPYLLGVPVFAGFLSCVCLSWMDDRVSCIQGHCLQIPHLTMVIFMSARIWIMAVRSHPSRGCIWITAWSLLIVVFFAQLSVGMTSPGCVFSWNVYAFNSVLLTIFCAFVAIMTFLAYPEQDCLFVCPELCMLKILILLSSIFIIVWISLNGIDLFFRGAFTATSLLMLMVQTWYPIWKSFAIGETPSKETLATIMPLPSGVSLEETLRSPIGFRAMKDFMTLERSVENLFCWQLLNDRERYSSNAQQICNRFRLVYNLFVRDESIHQVNIDFQLKSRFRKAIQELEANESIKVSGEAGNDYPSTELVLLGELYDEITRVMEQDSFLRFRATIEVGHL